MRAGGRREAGCRRIDRPDIAGVRWAGAEDEAPSRRGRAGSGMRPGPGRVRTPAPGAVRPSRDANVGGGAGLTQQGPAGPDLPLGQAAEPRALREVDAAGENPAPAGAAGAVAASVGKRHPLPERRIQEGFVRPGPERGTLRSQRDVEHRKVGGCRRAEGSGGDGAGVGHPYRGPEGSAGSGGRV